MNKFITTLVICFTSLSLIAGNINLETADDFYTRLAFSKAATFYTKYLKKNDDVNVWIKLADCYDKTNDYENLSATLGKIVKREDLTNDLVFLDYALVLQILEKPDEASIYYEKYLDNHASDSRAKNQLKVCMEAIKDESERFHIANMEFNTESFEYAPNFLNDAFVYTSTSSDGNTSIKEHNWTDASYSDLKQYDLDTLKVFILFNEMEKLNTKFDDGPFVVDPIDHSVYYTRNNYDLTKPFGKKNFGFDDNMNLKIYVAEHRLGNIEEAVEFEHNFPEYNTGHPAISPDGKFLVFTCDVPNSKKDTTTERNLYYSQRDDSTGWSKPKLLTSDINTEGDELFPYFHKDGSLYFASNGLGSYGGLDIYKADINFESNSLEKLEHLPYPINSTYDDFGIVFKNKTDGYFTSDRPEGKGHDDIYSFVDNTILLRGLIVNIENDEILPGSQITIGDQKLTILDSPTDSEARFETRVYKNKTYDLLADEDYFYETAKEVSTHHHKGNKPIEVVLKLQPIKYNVKVLDAVTKEPISNATVNIDFGCDQTSESVTTRSRGMHQLPVYKACEYKFKAKAQGYLLERLDWTSSNEDKDETVIIYLNEISFDPIVLKNIYYDFDESYLRLNESSEDLEKVYNFLRDNPELTVQINSHTDARGSHPYNEGLSQRRAQSVVNYLINRNIPISRLKAVGYGERLLVNHCSDGVRCSETDHQLNRRTEFQVINVDGSTKIKSDARNDITIDPCKGCPF